MVDERQKNLIETTEAAWGKPSVSIKGNFTWGLINK
jgi:hypothetical protein